MKWTFKSYNNEWISSEFVSVCKTMMMIIFSWWWHKRMSTIRLWKKSSFIYSFDCKENTVIFLLFIHWLIWIRNNIPSEIEYVLSLFLYPTLTLRKFYLRNIGNGQLTDCLIFQVLLLYILYVPIIIVNIAIF